MGRVNWYYEHPPTCSCAACTEKRSRKSYSTTSKDASKKRTAFTECANRSAREQAKTNKPSRRTYNLDWLWALLPVFLITIIAYVMNLPQPLKIYDINTDNITDSSAVINFKTSRECYSLVTIKLPDEGIWINYSNNTISKQSNHTYSITGLKRGRSFTYIIYAEDKKPVLNQDGYYSVNSEPASFETKISKPVISNLQITWQRISWNTDIPTIYNIYDYDKQITSSEVFSCDVNALLNLSPANNHKLVVKVTDVDGLSSLSEAIMLNSPLAGQFLPFISHVSEYGKVRLINNPKAINPTYGQLVAFLQMDNTDRYLYEKGVFTCGDYAEILYNNAQKAGWRAGFVVIKLEPPKDTDVYMPTIFGSKDNTQKNESGIILHACNAFETPDLGLVFIDNTGVSKDGKPSFVPYRSDKVVKIKKGEQYCPENIFQRSATKYCCMGTVLDYFVFWSGIN